MLCKTIRMGYPAMTASFSEKRKKTAVIGGAAAAVALPLFLLAPGNSASRQRAPFYGRSYAHRGLHSEDKSVPENSLEAFRLAAEAGYGVELDVQLSKDGKVVVFHDDTLDRVCDVNARVDEKTWNELQLLRLCGTGQRIPLLTEALDVIRGRGPLIVELKNGRRNRELCEKTLSILSDYEGPVCMESFNPLIVRWFRLHAKDLVRGQLATAADDYGDAVTKPTAFLLSRCLMNFLSRPQFIAYRIGPRPPSVRLSEALGAMRVGWTARDGSAERHRDAVIFEFYRPPQKIK